MRILFVGDVVGRSGRTVLHERLPRLIADWMLDLVVVNGENAAGGFGITETIYQEMIRPLNYPAGTPGRGAAMIEAKNGARVLVVNVMGRVFMDPLDDPFSVVEKELAACALKSSADAIIIDVHCEATSEKQAMGYFADGRASLVVGTHTHVPTSDHRILPHGTAFISDVGMTGDFESIIGMDREEPMTLRASQRGSPRCGLAVSLKKRCRLFGYSVIRLPGRQSQYAGAFELLEPLARPIATPAASRPDAWGFGTS